MRKILLKKISTIPFDWLEVRDMQTISEKQAFLIDMIIATFFYRK
jgi:hypothetical protein